MLSQPVSALLMQFLIVKTVIDSQY